MVKHTRWALKSNQDKGVVINFKTVFYRRVQNTKNDLYGMSSFICLNAFFNHRTHDPPVRHHEHKF